MFEFLADNKTIILISIPVAYIIWIVCSDYIVEKRFREKMKGWKQEGLNTAKEKFDDGLSAFHNGEYEKALVHFDNAFSLGYIEKHKERAAELFTLRGFTLENLDYSYDAIEDFSNALEHTPNDCNLYFSRSTSKTSILDYDGALEDLKIAIKFANENTPLTRMYNENAQSEGWESVAQMYSVFLIRSEYKVRLIKKETSRS